MSIGIISGFIIAAFAMGQGLWILTVRPDPPAGAVTATRKRRQLIAIGLIILGVFIMSLNASRI